MALYRDLFAPHNILVSQLLLSNSDIYDRSHYLNACSTFRESIDMGVLPVVNENDAVSVGEIKFGDNDSLSAIVAGMCQASFLFLLTDVDALYTQNPRIHPDATPIRLVSQLNELTATVDDSSGSSLGTGGMRTKLIAAELATTANVCMYILSAITPEVMLHVLESHPNSEVGTCFLPLGPMKDRKWWIQHGLKSKGTLYIDQGAYVALQHHASLLPAGIKQIIGQFYSSQAVDIALYQVDSIVSPCSSTPRFIGKGIVNYNSSELRLIMGKSSHEIETTLGYSDGEYAIERGSMILFTKECA
ncbi:hypothetical protein HMI54_006163 [Coelomomyces lativittatus]|nr:hypothetical protein HMI56_000977 [Coelomomyces lativittatus]KAJ1517301.1 hypothetical protein HMI54_006163 [Coelomomyces lativittatus]